MNDRTPSTEDVLLAYVDREDFVAQVGSIDRAPDEVYEAEFDRWLDKVKADVWDEGRNSIALDFLKPLREDGIREATRNPYREATQ